MAWRRVPKLRCHVRIWFATCSALESKSCCLLVSGTVTMSSCAVFPYAVLTALQASLLLLPLLPAVAAVPPPPRLVSSGSEGGETVASDRKSSGGLPALAVLTRQAASNAQL